jgi:hypothetical protein
MADKFKNLEKGSAHIDEVIEKSHILDRIIDEEM